MRHGAPAGIGRKPMVRWNRGRSRDIYAKCSPISSWWALETLVTEAWLGAGRRRSGERGGGGGPIGGEIGPLPSPPLSFDTTRFDGRKNSDKILGRGGEGLPAKEVAWRRCLYFGNKSATIYRGPALASLGSCGRLGAKGIHPARWGAIEKERSSKSPCTERAGYAVQRRARRH